MTKPSAAQKRKRRRTEREELQRIEEKAQHAPVSSLARLPFNPPTPTLVDNGDLAGSPVPHAVHTAPQPAVGASRQYYMPSFRFPEHWLYENVPVPPSQWPEHIREYIYGPASPEPSSWADDVPEPAAPTAIMTIVPAPRWSSLRSFGGNPWRAIRRRKRRLRADCSWQQPPSFEPHFDAPTAAPPLPAPPGPLQQGLSLRPADLLGLIPLHSDDPFHPNDIPPLDLPTPTLCLFPDDHLPRKFPVDTEFGPIAHKLAHACSRALPHAVAVDVANELRDIVWPPLAYPDGSFDISPEARLDLVVRLPPDHLIFLFAITQMGRLEHHFALLFNDAITEFVRRWVYHCELVGEAG
ncbi:hypothetical protein MVEN_00057400 [Mycena venus]|uniref:Uncharacterized protein n=1 Tax=Mycena venus TaxID=2733690 RepID=A0A8H6Z459_9AGAR|nr:hypothetical protein MVEN_00057400 [Mycena venus]